MKTLRTLPDEFKKALLHKRNYSLFGIFGSIVLVALMVYAIRLKQSDPTFGDNGPFVLSFFIGGFWLFLLGRSWIQFWQISSDLRAEQIDTISGQVQLNMRSAPGVISTMIYRVHCEGREFAVSQKTFFGLVHGQPYQLSYAPHANVFLSAEPLFARGLMAAPLSVSGGGECNEVEPLLKREQEILQLIALGLSNQEIADRLFLSINTVKMYASQIYRKLGVSRRTEAVIRAKQFNLLKS